LRHKLAKLSGDKPAIPHNRFVYFPSIGADMFRQILLATTVLVLAASASTASAQHRKTASVDANGNLDALIASQAAANGVPIELVKRVIKRESGGNPRVVSAGNYGLMQIKLGTARSMGYQGNAAGLLDPTTNMTYAVKYLSGAYQAAGGNADRAVHYYAAGYYYAAKRKGLMDTNGNATGAFAFAGIGNDPTYNATPAGKADQLRQARANGVSASSASSLYNGKLDYY
jgi:soluble lytic murein transglycosylase-like protein